MYQMNKPKFKQDMLDDSLRKMHAAVPGIRASVVVNRDGFLVASFPPSSANYREDLDDPTGGPQVAAMAATLSSLAERTLGKLARGDLERLLVEGEDGTMVVYPAGRATLAVLVNKDQKIGPVLYASDKTARTIADLLAS
jgi:uncharacterized protein